MNYVDLAVLAVLAVSGLLGLSRGFIRELLGLGAWAVAVWIAIVFGPSLIPTMQRVTGAPELGAGLAYLVVFVGSLIVMSIGANLIGRAVRLSALGGLDRTLGLLFGLVRGAALVIAAYIVGNLLIPPERWPAPVAEARSVPVAYEGARWAVGFIPPQYCPQYCPRVSPPPGAESTPDANALLHATPEGRALGPPASHD